MTTVYLHSSSVLDHIIPTDVTLPVEVWYYPFGAPHPCIFVTALLCAPHTWMGDNAWPRLDPRGSSTWKPGWCNHNTESLVNQQNRLCTLYLYPLLLSSVHFSLSTDVKDASTTPTPLSNPGSPPEVLTYCRQHWCVVHLYMHADINLSRRSYLELVFSHTISGYTVYS